MIHQIESSAHPRAAPRAPVAADRRRHKRIDITLLGRLMRANKQEYPCKLVNVSVGGAAMMSPVPADPEERIVAYFDHIGGIEGHVVRTFDGGFAIGLIACLHRREKLAAQLTRLAYREMLPPRQERRHDRLLPSHGAASVRLADGSAAPCQVVDVSISGASIATEARPPIGQEVVLGTLRASVVRHHDQGIGVAFLDIQNPPALRRSFG